MNIKKTVLTILTTTSCFNYCADTKRAMLDTAIKISLAETMLQIGVHLVAKQSIDYSIIMQTVAQVAIGGALGRVIVGPTQNTVVAGAVGVAVLSGTKMVKKAAQIISKPTAYPIGATVGALSTGAGAACMTTVIIATSTRTPIPLAIAAGTTMATYGIAQTSNAARNCVGMGIGATIGQAVGGALDGIIGALVVEGCKTIYNKCTQPKPSDK